MWLGLSHRRLIGRGVKTAPEWRAATVHPCVPETEIGSRIFALDVVHLLGDPEQDFREYSDCPCFFREDKGRP